MSQATRLRAAPSVPKPAAVIAGELRGAESVLILSHEYPDGDAIGSMLALRLALLALGKRVHCAVPHPCPTKYRFLPGSETIGTESPNTPADCAVALDCDGEARLAQLAAAFRQAHRSINIDHHEAECIFADLNWCDGAMAATGMMVYEVVRELGVPVTPEIATCLYTAVATDTGVFRFQNTSAAALAVAGELVAAGADPYETARRASDQMPLARALLLGRALASLSTYHAGKLLVATLARADFAEAGASPEHTDGVIDELKRVEGAEVIALLREETPGKWRVSLRSAGPDVAEVCRRLGGGGHRLAAGCEATGTRDQVTATVVREVGELVA